jgi:hypothetical protein
LRAIELRQIEAGKWQLSRDLKRRRREHSDPSGPPGRLEANAGARYVVGQDRDRDRKRREELFYLKLNAGLTEAQTAELAALDASFKNEDRDSRRIWELLFKEFETSLTDAEQIDYDQLQDRYPPDPNDPMRKRDSRDARTRAAEMAELFGAIARSAPADGGRNNE